MKRQEKDLSKYKIRQCLVDENKVRERDILLDKITHGGFKEIQEAIGALGEKECSANG